LNLCIVSAQFGRVCLFFLVCWGPLEFILKSGMIHRFINVSGHIKAKLLMLMHISDFQNYFIKVLTAFSIFCS